TGTGATFTVNGNSNSVTFGSTSTGTLSGTGNHVVAAGDTINFAGSSKATVAGPSNAVGLSTSDQIFVNGSSDTVQVQSGDIVDLASNVTVTIIGNGATIVGNTGDTISLSGTGDNVYADSSYVQVNGTDTGDVVHGSSDTGNRSNWGGYIAESGAYGGYAAGGYYSAPPQGRSARMVRNSSPGGLADVAAIGAADQLVHALASWTSPNTSAATTPLEDPAMASLVQTLAGEPLHTARSSASRHVTG